MFDIFDKIIQLFHSTLPILITAAQPYAIYILKKYVSHTIPVSDI